ncbi:MAG: hypothetical protein IJS50_05560, partial [Desulfovibrio sp.]|nr:hypothetical protein [Desulfovibrio sp.]
VEQIKAGHDNGEKAQKNKDHKGKHRRLPFKEKTLNIYQNLTTKFTESIKVDLCFFNRFKLLS